MKIGLDMRVLQKPDRFRGIGMYLVSLISALAQIDQHNQYNFFFWPEANPLGLLRLPQGFQWKLVELRKPMQSVVRDRMRNWLRRDIRISKSDADVFLQPDSTFGRPSGNVPTVTVAYDLIPLIFWKRYFSASGKPLLRRGLKHQMSAAVQACLYRWHLRELVGADRIVVISHATEQDVLRYFPLVDRQRIVVIHPACDSTFRPAPDRRRVRDGFGITRDYLLYCGGTDFRKNVPGLLHAYDRLRTSGRNVQLVLVGREFEREGSPESPAIDRLIRTSQYETDIIRTGFIETNDLVALYSSAAAFVFPSLYEGFGMPLLEAMACGCPVIAYRNSSIPEVAGAAGILLEPTDSLEEAIVKVLSDRNLRARMTAEGLRQARNFSWEKSSRAILKVLEDAASSPASRRPD